jgi:hypothetical protein
MECEIGYCIDDPSHVIAWRSGVVLHHIFDAWRFRGDSQFEMI